ncbi:MAG: hypothetical protein H5U03_01630 [Clostridia bacterium]|nr:hypothetical protein [Clostridia bacterium]
MIVQKAVVTDEGVWIPRDLLGDVRVVEIRKDQHTLLIVPLEFEDPILLLGSAPVAVGITDAAEHHD